MSEITTDSEPSARPRRIERPVEFWIGQLMVIVATVVGVYLAATTGFEVAVQFELVRADREHYYLLSALEAELADNVATVDEFVGSVEAGRITAIVDANRPELDTYVWETMKESSSTFETPAIVLTGVRRFYGTVEEKLDRAERRELRGKPLAEQLAAANSEIKDVVLPTISERRATLTERLASANVDLD